MMRTIGSRYIIAETSGTNAAALTTTFLAITDANLRRRPGMVASLLPA
jgi:hypothetical protein